jgi:hypothetical protein
LTVSVSQNVSSPESYIIGANYVAVGNSSEFCFGTSSFSFGAWINSSYTGDFQNIFDATNFVSSPNKGWQLDTKTTTGMRLWLTTGSSNSSLDTSTQVTDGQWHHVGFTWYGGSPNLAVLYIDGSADTSSGAMGSIDQDGGAYAASIGFQVEGSNYPFNGLINEVVLYDALLSSTQMAALAATDSSGRPAPPDPASGPSSLPSTSNLKGYWRNDGNTTWTDRSGEGNNGTVEGLPADLLFKQGYNGSASTSTGRDGQGFPLWYQNNGAIGFNGDGYVNGAIVFNGSGPYISLGTCPTDLEMAQTSETTILAWVKLDRRKGSNGIISAFSSTSYPGWSLCCYEATYNKAMAMLVSDGADGSAAWLRQYYDGGGGAVPAGKTPEMLVDRWYHVAVTISRISGTTSVYYSQDGVKNVTPVINSSEGGSTGWGNGKELIIGRAATGWGDFNGQIANVQIYKTILTDAQILQNYNAQRSRFNA